MGGPLSSSIAFKVLGPLTVTLEGSDVNVGGAKQQLVLAALLLDANRVVAADRLIEWVWGDDDHDPKRAATLQVYVSNLRRALQPAASALGHPVIDTRRPGYVAVLTTDTLDVLAFTAEREKAAAEIEAGRPAAAVEHLRAAIGLWRGEPLAGLPVGANAAGFLARLDAERVASLEKTAELELSLGRHRERLPELREWVDQHPLDERLRAHLMLALYRCGRQADALDCYQQGRKLLVDELGIDPSRELRQLEQKILDQDRSLELTSTVFNGGMSETVRRLPTAAGGATITVDGETIAIDRLVMTVGRHPDRHLVVRDSLASRHHAEIRWDGCTHRVVDLGSANGTTVNGTTVTEHELVDRDVIGIGDTDLTFHLTPET